MKKEILIALFVIGAIFIVGCDTTGDILKTSESTRAQYTCQDTDGGFNYEELGTVSGNEGRRGSYQYTDTCLDQTRLKEWYCQGSIAEFDQYRCQGGCENGACL